MKSAERVANEKRPYQCPKLVTYGDFRTLTGVKGGAKGDGIGKGNTRLKGGKRQ